MRKYGNVVFLPEQPDPREKKRLEISLLETAAKAGFPEAKVVFDDDARRIYGWPAGTEPIIGWYAETYSNH